MSLNLDPIRQMVERDFLDDLVEVRPASALPQGNLTATLDHATLALTPPPDPAPIWNGVASLISLTGNPTTSPPMVADDSAPPPDDATYKILLPLAAPLFQKDQVLVVTGSRLPTGPRDPHIVGTRFRFVRTLVPVHTYAVVRMAFLAEV